MDEELAEHAEFMIKNKMCNTNVKISWLKREDTKTGLKENRCKDGPRIEVEQYHI